MSEIPENDVLHPQDSGARTQEPLSDPEAEETWQVLAPLAVMPDPSPMAEDAETHNLQSVAEPPLFHSWYQPEIQPPTRIPHLGHLCILAALASLGTVGAVVLSLSAFHFHLFGVSTLQQANNDIHYALGSEAILYLLTFGGCLLVFPVVWHEGFFTGLQWNSTTALRLRWRIFAAAGLCFALAMVDEVVLPGPANAPIEKLFQNRAAAWLLFGFGVTFAPFFEEMLFRGFLLPALCTACDWTAERFTHRRPRPLDAHGHPQWSMPAMVAASVLTSIPFALMHGEQTGYSLGPFALLVCISLILCGVRLGARSLASSILVHASYNFLIFTLMLLGTSGFTHLDKM